MDVKMSEKLNNGSIPIYLSVAWLAILPASPFADIICGAILHAPMPAWLPFVNLGASVVLLALAYVWPSLQPIRGYLRSITLLVLGYLVMLQVESTETWRVRFSEAPTWQFVFADSILDLIPCLLLTLGLVHSGLTRRELFLTRGNLRASFLMPDNSGSEQCVSLAASAMMLSRRQGYDGEVQARWEPRPF